MPKKMKPEEVLKKMEWLESLPDSGGSWGRGLIETGHSIVAEVEKLEQEKKGIAKQIGDRMRVLRALPGRAAREAPLMYDSGTVELARSTEEIEIE